MFPTPWIMWAKLGGALLGALLLALAYHRWVAGIEERGALQAVMEANARAAARAKVDAQDKIEINAQLHASINALTKAGRAARKATEDGAKREAQSGKVVFYSCVMPAADYERVCQYVPCSDRTMPDARPGVGTANPGAPAPGTDG